MRALVLDDPGAVAAAAAARIVEAAAAAIAARGSFRIALSGGTTPERLYRLLAAPPMRARVDWARVVVLFADERAVAPDDAGSNVRLVRETLIDPLGPGAAQVRRMRGEAEDLEAAAREYEAELEEPIDLLLMGVGEDGHTASIFPGRAAASEMRRRCVVVPDSPKPPARRLTLTPRTLGEARGGIVLVTGSEKAAAVAEALAPGATAERCPASLLRAREWLIDRAAGARLRR